MKATLRLAAVAGAALLAAGAAFAQDLTPEQAYEQRQALMKENGGYMRILVPVAKGEAQVTDETRAAAQGLVDNAQAIAALFPEGTGPETFADTEAKPEIWADFAKFEADAKRLEGAAAQLVAALEAGDQAEIARHVQAVGGSCGACHESFRVKK